jgi:hypothetical protein
VEELHPAKAKAGKLAERSVGAVHDRACRWPFERRSRCGKGAGLFGVVGGGGRPQVGGLKASNVFVELTLSSRDSFVDVHFDFTGIPFERHQRDGAPSAALAVRAIRKMCLPRNLRRRATSSLR